MAISCAPNPSLQNFTWNFLSWIEWVSASIFLPKTLQELFEQTGLGNIVSMTYEGVINQNREAIATWNKLKLKWKEDLVNKIASELVMNEKIIRETAWLVVEDWLFYNAFNNIKSKWDKNSINDNRLAAFRNEWIETPFWRYRPEQMFFYADDSVLKNKTYRNYKESKKVWRIETSVWGETWEVISYSYTNKRWTK